MAGLFPVTRHFSNLFNIASNLQKQWYQYKDI